MIANVINRNVKIFPPDCSGSLLGLGDGLEDGLGIVLSETYFFIQPVRVGYLLQKIR